MTRQEMIDEAVRRTFIKLRVWWTMPTEGRPFKASTVDRVVEETRTEFRRIEAAQSAVRVERA